MIHVIATIHLRPARLADFLAEFRALAPLVHGEEGCIEYGPAVDLATSIQLQSPTRSDVVTVIEKWESVAALESHLAAPHMDAYREAVKDLVTRVEIQILKPA